MEAKSRTGKNIIAIYSNKYGDKMYVTSNRPYMASPEFRDIIREYLERLEDLTDVLHLVIDRNEPLAFTIEKYKEGTYDYLYDVKFTSEEFNTGDDSHRIERISEDMNIEEALDYIQSFHDFCADNPDTWLF